MTITPRFRGWLWGATLSTFLLLGAVTAAAKDIGAEAPKCATCSPCTTCPRSSSSGSSSDLHGHGGVPSTDQGSSGGTTISRSEGNLTDRVDLASVMSARGATLSLAAVYNSYNADMSRVQLDTVMGYGWTHSYNVFLFRQVGSMFRFDGDGRVTRYKMGAGDTFAAAPGYFETLVKNPDGSFSLTQKDGTILRFKQIAGTPFVVVSQVWRLTTITDRNGNVTTLTYASGRLTSVSDTYGRAITFTYTAQNKVQTITDPAGRVTTFTYDVTGRKLTRITDPTGKFQTYTYNTLYQLLAKVDKAGRMFTYTYVNLKPTSVRDGSYTSSAILSNPVSWATNSTQLAMNQTRVYTPSTTTRTDGRGNLWRYQYDSRGYLIRETAPGLTFTQYSYHPTTLRLSSAIDPLGHTTSYTYDAQGNMLTETNTLGHATTYTYDPAYNNVTSVTDHLGRTTSYTYDAQGNRTQEVDHAGSTQSWTYDSHGDVLTHTDRNSRTTTYTYDATGNVASRVDALGNTTSYAYDAVGNRTSTTDANSHTTTYSYDGMNRRRFETDAFLNATETRYDGAGNRTQSIDRNGRTTTYLYDYRHRLTSETDPAGTFDAYTYDGNDNRLTHRDRNNRITTYLYDSRNRPIRTTDAMGNVTQTTYDAGSNVTSEIDANNRTTTYLYDPLHRRTQSTNALTYATQYGYDGGTMAGCPSCGITPGSATMTSTTDPLGRVTYYKYDSRDRQIRVVRKVGSAADTIGPADAVTAYTYDPEDNRLSETDPNGNTTTYVYDAMDRRTHVTNAEGETTVTTYDPVGNSIVRTDANGRITSATYDDIDRRTAVVDQQGPIASYVYDPVGHMLSQEDGNSNTTSYQYDVRDRLITTTDPAGKQTTFTYDPVGNQLTTTDRNSETTTHTYDAINRRTTTADPLGHTTTYQYDPVGNRTGITDANGRVTSYQYDVINRMTRETYADGEFRTLAYDAAGNLISRVDQIGRVTTYAYNDLNQLTARSYPSLVNDAFTYDLAGRMLTALRGGWLVTMTHDAADRLLTSSQDGRNVSYVYDVANRTRTVTYPGGRAITEETDVRGRLDNIDDGAPGLAQYTWDDGNRVSQRVYRNGTTATWLYDANNRATTVEHMAGPTLIAKFNYDYDFEGNKKYEEKVHDAGRSESYEYDPDYRLIDYKVGTLSGSTVSLPVTQTAYTLDPVGNWTSTVTDSVTETRTHNTVNELTQIDAAPLTYDDNGNVLNDGLYLYVHDEEDRLTTVTRVSDSALVGQYQYDALGRRVVKVASPAMTFDTTAYLYDGDRVIEEQNSSSVTQATYVYGIHLDDVLTMDRGGQAYYFHHSALSTVAAVTDSASAVVERYAYDAYGRPAVTDGSASPVSPNAWGTPHSAIGNHSLFTGRDLDEDTGLYFYRARYYDADKGRFLQHDPKGYVDGMNLYEYSRSNPVRFSDPSGKVAGQFTGGENRGAVAAGIRGVTNSSYTLECECTNCTNSYFLVGTLFSSTCYKITCTFNTSGVVTIIPHNHDLWKSDHLDRRYGNRTGTYASRLANVRSHEQDHQKTTEAFDTYNRGKLAEEEGKCHAGARSCATMITLIRLNVSINYDRAMRHSAAFDTAQRNTGDRYAAFPLDNQTWTD